MITTDWLNSAWITPSHQHNYFQIFGDISHDNCHAAIDWILFHNTNKTFESLHLIIDSEGGDLGPAMALSDVLLSSKIPVTTYGLGSVGSAALVAFLAGHHRIITENTSILSHQFSWDSGEQKFHDLKAMSKEISFVHDRMFKFYKRQTLMTDQIIETQLLSPSDRWLNAAEAVKYNLAHKSVKAIDMSHFASIGIA